MSVMARTRTGGRDDRDGDGGRPRKTGDAKKATFLSVRVTAEQKEIMTEAAEHVGIDVSAWLRMVGLQEARYAKSVRRRPVGGRV